MRWFEKGFAVEVGPINFRSRVSFFQFYQTAFVTCLRRVFFRPVVSSVDAMLAGLIASIARQTFRPGYDRVSIGHRSVPGIDRSFIFSSAVLELYGPRTATKKLHTLAGTTAFTTKGRMRSEFSDPPFALFLV